jgi:glycosyltransferase involved in cell wall biosynthesis
LANNGRKINCPELSVLMSVYNGEKYLQDAVDSILKQTFNDFEFIIINDGSTDRTREIIEGYNDDRIVLINQENTGLTKSLNKGLSLARGEYIARMDADDLSKPERLEKQLMFLRDNPEVVLLGSNCYRIDEDGNVLWISNLPTEEVNIKWCLLFCNFLFHGTVMFRGKEINDLGGYNSTVSYAQDYDLWLRIAERYPIACLKEPLIYYRIPRKGTITYEKESEQTKQAEQTYLEVICKIIPEITFMEDEIKELRCFISGNCELKNVDSAEKLFLRIYHAFCNSSFAPDVKKGKLAIIKIEPYSKFAWEYFKKGSVKDFDRCIRELLDSGFQGPLAVPDYDLYKSEKNIMSVLNNYFSCDSKNIELKRKGKNFLATQYHNLSWQYYSLGDMSNFRRCLMKLLKNRPSGKVITLLLKSLLGKRAMEALHRLRVKHTVPTIGVYFSIS